MERAFNEDTRVKLPATIHFLRLDYRYQSLKTANVDFNTKIFINRFKPALEKLNGRAFSDDEIKIIIGKINSSIKNNDLGKDFHNWLVRPTDRVKLIDFENIALNDFAVVAELPFNVSKDKNSNSFRPDVNILINGMPLSFFEAKKPNNPGGIQKEFDRMINDRLENDLFKKFFNMFQVVSFSNNMPYEEISNLDIIRAGSFYTTPNGKKTTFSFFREANAEEYISKYNYKEVSTEVMKDIVADCNYDPDVVDTPEFQENLSVYTPCNSFITSLYDKERLLYFIKYGIAFIDDTVPERHIMRYPQFFASRRIVERLDLGDKRGIIWHTQGSGKTALAAYSTNLLKDYYKNKGINTRFFFIVDQLNLLRQVSAEFKMRGFNVVTCDSRKEFMEEFEKPIPINLLSDDSNTIYVVNIQKLESRLKKIKNKNNANSKNIFFIDEAHRSYASNGEYYKNLMCCDTDAIFLALTGTPILDKKERTNLKFGNGDYIHKYFYNESIADGYTLKIKKENIGTVVKSEIRRNLEIENGKILDKDIYESDAYINCLAPFIAKDFIDFRLINNDNSVGGMIVCYSNEQARKMHEWFEKNSKLQTGLVITDEENPEQSKINKKNQIEFKKSFKIDILIVNMMLTTGYDARRLKKMYLLRVPHAHSLLQTISRVNRPYTAPNGRVYKYGYIVDFVDIAQEFETTVDAYTKELLSEINNEEMKSLEGLVVGHEEIKAKYEKDLKALEDLIDISNAEIFSNKLLLFNKETLFTVKKLINNILECETEFILSGAFEDAEKIDNEKFKKLLNVTKERLSLLNLKDRPMDVINVLSNREIVELLYGFVKNKVSIMNLGCLSFDDSRFDDFKNVLREVQDEIKENKNKDDIRLVKLNQMLQEIFEKLSMSDLSNIDDITCELRSVLTDVQAINKKNKELSELYGGNYAFVKTYQEAILNFEIDKSIIEKMLFIIYNQIKDILDTESIMIQGRDDFINTTKQKITTNLLKEKIYKDVKDFYTQILKNLYVNIQLFK